MADPTAPAAPAPAKAAKGGQVTVACKMPNGVVLNFNRYERVNEQTLDIHKHVDTRRIVLKGYAHKVGEPPPVLIAGGYALTNVDADLWGEWVDTHKGNDLLSDRLIFAASTPDRAVAQAREQAKVPAQFPPTKPSEVKGVSVATDDKGKPLIKHNEAALADA